MVVSGTAVIGFCLLHSLHLNEKGSPRWWKDRDHGMETSFLSWTQIGIGAQEHSPSFSQAGQRSSSYSGNVSSLTSLWHPLLWSDHAFAASSGASLCTGRLDPPAFSCFAPKFFIGFTRKYDLPVNTRSLSTVLANYALTRKHMQTIPQNLNWS